MPPVAAGIVQMGLGLFKLYAGGCMILSGLDGLTASTARLTSGLGRTGRTGPSRTGSIANAPAQMRQHRAVSLADSKREMRRLVREGKLDPALHKFVADVLAQRCGKSWCAFEKDYDAEVAAIFRAVRERVRYAHDPYGVDTFQHPVRTLQHRRGDCDDYAILLSACLENAGYRCWGWIIETVDAEPPGEFNHILIIVEVPAKFGTPKRVALDGSMKHEPGWHPPMSMIKRSDTFEFK